MIFVQSCTAVRFIHDQSTLTPPSDSYTLFCPLLFVYCSSSLLASFIIISLPVPREVKNAKSTSHSKWYSDPSFCLIIIHVYFPQQWYKEYIYICWHNMDLEFRCLMSHTFFWHSLLPISCHCFFPLISIQLSWKSYQYLISTEVRREIDRQEV